jgi:hypothetical protein
VQYAVHVERIAHVPVGAVPESFAAGEVGDSLLHLTGLRPVTLGQHLLSGLDGGAAGVELERPVHHLDLVAVLETGQRRLEPRFADIAPRADDVAPDLHAHADSLESRLLIQ